MKALKRDRANRLAQALTRFVRNPVTILAKGMILLLIGLSEASRTFSEDLVQRQLRVGHGLVIIGIFAILDALPNLIDGIDASLRYWEIRERNTRPESVPGVGPREDGVHDP